MKAITASYQEHDDEWSVTVAGMGQELTEHAPGIIAARDQAEQLVDSLKPEDGETAVVHLLHGSALEFTTAYMTARLTRTGNSGDSAGHAETGPAIPEQASGAQEAAESARSGASAEAGHPAERAGADSAETDSAESDSAEPASAEPETDDADDSAQELAK